MSTADGLTVAVTGPTGEIGKPLVAALERARSVSKIIGMARRPFDPASHGWKKTEYRQGDVLDRKSVAALVAGADVVVHLAFVIMGSHDETRRVNLEGSRNVFEATLDAGIGRLVYASSVAAYGFHEDNPQPLTEDVPARGSDAFYYSSQKAELEELLGLLLLGSSTDTYVFRPCVVAGPNALMLIRNIPYVALSEKLPAPARALLDVMPILKPVIPDPGVPIQLVHEDDVATAMRAAIQGRGEPGVYNLAGSGTITIGDVADALGWYSIPVPELGVDVAAEIVGRIPFLPAELSWVHALRVPVVMDASKAKRKLGWRPKHSTRQTLRAAVAGAREQLLR